MPQQVLLEPSEKIIMEHNKNPKNFGRLTNACCRAIGQNSCCGDYVDIYVCFSQGEQQQKKITKISFEGEGCTIVKASASMMTELLLGKTLSEAYDLFSDFLRLIGKELPYSEKLDQANIFSGVTNLQSRMQCAMLPWNTLIRGLGLFS